MFFVPFWENIIFCLRPATTNHSQTQQPHYTSQLQHRCICCMIALIAAILHNTRDCPDITEHFVSVLSNMPHKSRQSNAITGARRLLQTTSALFLLPPLIDDAFEPFVLENSDPTMVSFLEVFTRLNQLQNSCYFSKQQSRKSITQQFDEDLLVKEDGSQWLNDSEFKRKCQMSP